MSGGRPPCRECKGKFGSAVWGNVCELCGLVRQLTGHLLSSRFPAQEGATAVRLMRECFHKVLEHSDTYWGAQTSEQSSSPTQPGGSGGKKEEKKEKGSEEPAFIAVKEEPSEKIDKRPLEAPEVKEPLIGVPASSPSPPPGLTGKAPPAKPPSKSSHRESEDTPGKRERGRSEKAHTKEKKHKRRRKTRSPKSRSASKDHKRRKRSEKRSEERRSELRSPEGASERKKAKPSSVPPTSARGSAAPRSPSHPPPEDNNRRGYYQEPYWRGPIPAARGREDHRGDSPRRANKGVKKRQQQERARALGWKFHGDRRWR